ncbi:hypothetical protein ACQ4PT_010825 [Festuca glaucescens]
MALHQRDAAGGAKEETGELYGDGGGAEAGQPAHARGPVPKWSEQLTARGLVVSAAVGIMYSVIVMKLNLTTGLDPTLTSPPRSSPSSSSASGRTRRPASASPSARSRARRTPSSRHAPSPATASAPPVGLGPICLGSARRPTRPAGTDIEGNVGWKEPGIGWMTGYLFAVSFVGILALVPLRKILVIDYKLTYPSGTATAVLINGFHAPQGDDVAKMQVKGFTKYFAISFFWSFFQWFYSGGDKCGFSQFPTLGLRARKQTFFFDFNLTYVGAGMICPHLINISLLLGSILSYGIMWPLISDLKGNWYPADLPESSMRSLQGYKGIHLHSSHPRRWHVQFCKDYCIDHLEYSQQIRKEEHQESILIGSCPGFLQCLRIGLTDINMAFNYGKVALLILAATAGKEHGVVAGMVGCGMVKSIASISADLMQDFKTGHLTLTSPRSMLIAQIVGTVMGCVIAPLAFFVFYNAFDIGNLNGPLEGTVCSNIPKHRNSWRRGLLCSAMHCLQLCCGFFAFALVANLMRDFLHGSMANGFPYPWQWGFPSLLARALPSTCVSGP